MLTGVDVSIWQHPGGAEIDYELSVKHGVDFAIIEYRDEASTENPYFLKDHDGFKKAGARTGSYCFLRPELELAPQAEDLRMLAKYGPVWGDLEVTGGLSSTELRAWWSVLKEAAPHIGLASYPAFIEENGLLMHTMPLWVDDWGVARAPSDALLWGMTAQARVPGISAYVDLDGFTGTSAQFNLLFPNAVAKVTINGVTFTPSGMIILPNGSTAWGVPSGEVARELERAGAKIIHNPDYPAGKGLFVEEAC